MINIYNTLNGTKEAFTPLQSDTVGIYVCGMTVYDYCHIGHARVMVCFDMIVRHLRFRFPHVRFVRNITDVDDKIIRRAYENGEDITSLTLRYIDAMHKDERALNVLSPDVEPKATEHIRQMQELVQTLIDKDFAYIGNNKDVYFKVDAFEGYGKLSGKNITDLIAGNRVEVEPAKRNALDFVLWKNTATHDVFWRSPWGKGRPGWHLECSAMSKEHLGEQFDIHGGGADLTFPHHENEIAQSECAYNKIPAHYWMHVGFVNIDGEKMSKSLGNFFTIKDVLKKYDGEVIRYFIISSHYRSPLNYSEDNLITAKQNLTKLYIAIRDIATYAVKDDNVYVSEFYDALDDDFNTPAALAVLYRLAKDINTATDDKPYLASILKQLGHHLGILQNNSFFSTTTLNENRIESKILERITAKQIKDYAKADTIRKELLDMGIILEDTKEGTTWRRV